MLSQFRPQYIGMSHPFTLPVAVGGIDIPGQERWRRPTWEEVSDSVARGMRAAPLMRDGESSWPGFEAQEGVGAGIVRLFDLTRGLARPVEGQYRRHWSFVPSLWNLYFRDRVNLGVSLRNVNHGACSTPAESEEQDAGVAAAELYRKLEHGTYVDQSGKRRKKKWRYL